MYKLKFFGNFYGTQKIIYPGKLSKRNRIKAASLAGLLSLSAIFPFQKPVEASRNYQEREGIYGELKFVEFCNKSNAIRFRAIAEAGSRDSRVSSVEFKVSARYDIGLNAWGQTLGYTTGESWRHEGTRYNNLWGSDRRFYEVFFPVVPLGTGSQKTPVKVAIHVNHSRGKTVDLGGVVDLGEIPVGSCRIYDDGNLRDG